MTLLYLGNYILIILMIPNIICHVIHLLLSTNQNRTNEIRKFKCV